MAFATRITRTACLLGLLFPAQVRSQETWFDLPLAGGTRTLAAFGIARADRAEALPLLARILYGQESRADAAAVRLAEVMRSDAGSSNAAKGAAAVDIPVPLTHDAWSGLLALAPGEDLPTRLLTDRAATLLAAGLVATDSSVRTLALRDRELLARLYREVRGAFCRSDLTLFARRAAEARVTLHIVQPAESMFDSDKQRQWAAASAMKICSARA